MLLGGCSRDPDDAPDTTEKDARDAAEAAAAELGAVVLESQRELVVEDIAHYTFLLELNGDPLARVRVHRVVQEDAPWQPRPTPSAVMLLHGDFATFTTNFAISQLSASLAPGQDLAGHLASQGVEVWGLDRRWTLAPAQGADLTSFADMGYASALGDTATALNFAATCRTRNGTGEGRLILGGFSSGGQLAMLQAATEAQLPEEERRVGAVFSMDMIAGFSPDDAALRAAACTRRDEAREQIAGGLVDSDNSFFISVGELAISAPEDPSPLFEGLTNRSVLLTFLGQTSILFEPTPGYHLAGATLEADGPTGLRYSSEAVVADWLAHAPPHQSLLETADLEALWCGEEPLPVSASVSDIDVPLLYLGAAGGFGAYGEHTTEQVGAELATFQVVSQLDPEQRDEDFGHGDLLYGTDARALAWEPLAAWILQQ